jgi:cell division protease FtsH
VVKEIVVGVSAGVLVFLIRAGYDVTPIAAIAVIGYLASMIFSVKGFGKKFEVVDNASSSAPISGVSFNDIGGQEVAKRELLEALDFIRNQEVAKHLGIRPLKGILLSGPPGTGKTLLAKAAAGYTDSAFVATSGSEFVEMYAGVGAQRVRQLFRNAKTEAEKRGKKNAIVFIDEIDVIGGKRGVQRGHLEYDQTLNQLLVMMDGITSDDSIRTLVVAATNRIDLLDSALLRPGRFDRIVKVELPDKEGRLVILKIHTKNKPLGEDVDLEKIARETFGFSGAQLEMLTNEAAILALRQSKNVISEQDFRDAIDKVMMGEKLERIW